MEQNPVATLSTLWQLSRRARLAENPAMLGFVIVNESLQLLPYRQSALWIRGKNIVAVSGLPQTERDAPYVQWLHALCAALPARNSAWILDANALPPELSPSCTADWDDWLPAYALALPLQSVQGHHIGWWLLAGDANWSEADISIASELSQVYAHAWQSFRPPSNWRHRLRSWIDAGKRQRKLALAIGVALVFPVRLSVMVPAEVTPKDSIPIRAPAEGAIDMVHVQPNQAVQENQPLFDLDTTGLRSRLSIAHKAYETATEEYRQAAQLAVTEVDQGRMEISLRKGRMDEKAAELNYTQEMLERVLVKSPRAGVAIFSDASEWIGKALITGEKVMQIADPNQVNVTLRLPTADAIRLETGAPVTVYLRNAKQFSYDARLSYSAYRAETGADGIASYRLRADFLDNEPLPRLGLTGTARLRGDWVPLVYYFLRRPIGALRQYVGF